MALEAVVDAVVTFVREHEGWAAPVAFAIAFGESFCFFSLILPGTAILAGVAALLAASGIDAAILTPVILAAGVGGTLGYAVSYWIGLYFKDSIHTIWPFTTRPQMIEQGKVFFERYGAFGVFLGHFFGPVRAVIPIVAGMFGMRQIPFQIANVLSAFIWAVGIIAPSFFLVTFKDEVFAFLVEHRVMALSIIAALAALNAIPRPLFFFPSLLAMMAIGTIYILIKGDAISAFAAAAAGAFLGDIYAYVTGVISKRQRQGAWPFAALPDQHKRAGDTVDAWGVAAVLISKAQGFNRGLVPLECGIREKPTLLPFIATSAVSAALWSAAALAPALLITYLKTTT